MTITAQQLRELAGKADALPFGDEWVGLKEGIQHLLWHNIPTIISALELQERLGKPETVERVARALCLREVRMGDTDRVAQQRVDDAWHGYIEPARAAIAAITKEITDDH